jgi:hypothetical protein
VPLWSYSPKMPSTDSVPVVYSLLVFHVNPPPGRLNVANVPLSDPQSRRSNESLECGTKSLIRETFRVLPSASVPVTTSLST